MYFDPLRLAINCHENLHKCSIIHYVYIVNRTPTLESLHSFLLKKLIFNTEQIKLHKNNISWQTVIHLIKYQPFFLSKIRPWENLWFKKTVKCENKETRLFCGFLTKCNG